MKHFAGIFTLLVLMAFCLSRQAAASDSTSLHVDFQEGFQKSPVTLLIDDRVVFDKTISTNHVIGRADGIVISISQDSVLLTLKCSSVDYTRTVNLADGHYISLSISHNKVTFAQSKGSFIYE